LLVLDCIQYVLTTPAFHCVVLAVVVVDDWLFVEDDGAVGVVVAAEGLTSGELIAGVVVVVVVGVVGVVVVVGLVATDFAVAAMTGVAGVDGDGADDDRGDSTALPAADFCNCDADAELLAG
jgi:hypothetical protein